MTKVKQIRFKATEREIELAESFGISVKMLRYYALRMIVELDKGTRIDPEDCRRLFNISSGLTMNKVFQDG